MNPYDITPILERVSGREPRSADYIFSPGFAPRMVVDGQLAPFPMKELKTMSPYQVEMLAYSPLIPGQGNSYWYLDDIQLL